VVTHSKYGMCTVGGVDRKRQTISLHDYRTNKRLTQGAKIKDCRVLTWVAWRSWFIASPGTRGEGGELATPTPASNKGRLFPPRV
jgi:hypothetical protein